MFYLLRYWENKILPTLYNDICCSVYGINIIGGKTGVLSSISLDHILNIKAPGGGDVDASVVGQGGPITLCPGDPGLRLACGTTLQGHTLSHQHLSVLGLDHKTWPCCSGRGEGGGREDRGNGVGLIRWEMITHFLLGLCFELRPWY